MSTLYNKMVDIIEQKVSPVATKMGQQPYIVAIRDGFISALPFMIVGSFILVFVFPPFSADSTWSFAQGCKVTIIARTGMRISNERATPVGTSGGSFIVTFFRLRSA